MSLLKKLRHRAKMNKATTQISVGTGRIERASQDGGGVLGKRGNKERLAMAREGAKNFFEGTFAKNTLKRKMAEAKNPPKKKKKNK